MKTLAADKVKDGYSVKIIDTRHLPSESDVYKLARQEGLKVKLSSEKRIFAE